MRFTRIASDGGAIDLHVGVTVVTGLDAEARQQLARELDQAAVGSATATRIETDAGPMSAIPGAPGMSVLAENLPGAVVHAPQAADADSGLEAQVGEARGRLQQAEASLTAAERALSEASAARTAAGRGLDRAAAAAVTAAEAALTAARTREATARTALEAAETELNALAAEGVNKATRAGRGEMLRAEQTNLERQRSALVAQLVAAGDPGDSKPVEEALAGLRRLRSVKPKPSADASALADRWVSVRQDLAKLPQPPQPPEWLVTPALASLQEAQAALAALESGSPSPETDPTKVAALDVAHREVLEAEQKAMKKGSRANRRRLDLAHDAEQTALAALGVNSYGEFLQRVAPLLDSPTGGRDRLDAARAAVADAEAVWEELHGGQASPQWTKLKAEQAKVRTEAHALLGDEVEDAALERALRDHLESVVDSDWAEQALVTALGSAGVIVGPGVDPEKAADEWLASVPEARQSREAVEAELSQLDGRLTAVEEELAEHHADAFFADEPSTPDEGAVERLRAALDQAVATVAKAEGHLNEAMASKAEADGKADEVAALETAESSARAEVDRRREALAEAKTALVAVEQRVAAAASSDRPLAGGVDLSAVVGMEAEAYLLARVASLRGAPGGPLPMVVDAAVIAGLSDGASRRVLRLLSRLAGSMQLIVLGDNETITTWAAGLGDQAAVRTVAR